MAIRRRPYSTVSRKPGTFPIVKTPERCPSAPAQMVSELVGQALRLPLFSGVEPGFDFLPVGHVPPSGKIIFRAILQVVGVSSPHPKPLQVLNTRDDGELKVLLDQIGVLGSTQECSIELATKRTKSRSIMASWPQLIY